MNEKRKEGRENLYNLTPHPGKASVAMSYPMTARGKEERAQERK